LDTGEKAKNGALSGRDEQHLNLERSFVGASLYLSCEHLREMHGAVWAVLCDSLAVGHDNVLDTRGANRRQEQRSARACETS
jgi:hypothetical protein